MIGNAGRKPLLQIISAYRAMKRTKSKQNNNFHNAINWNP